MMAEDKETKPEEARRRKVREPHDSPHCVAHLGSVYYHPSLNFKTLPPLFIVVHSSQNCTIHSLLPFLPHKVRLRAVSCRSGGRSYDAFAGCRLSRGHFPPSCFLPQGLCTRWSLILRFSVPNCKVGCFSSLNF